jgi:hypothetical protein
MLLKKLENAKSGIEITRKGFEDLAASLPMELQEKWRREEAVALQKGGVHLNVYDLKLPKGRFARPAYVFVWSQDIQTFIAPTQAEIQLQLAENESSQSVQSGAVSWLSSGIEIEQAQYVHMSSILVCKPLLTSN